MLDSEPSRGPIVAIIDDTAPATAEASKLRARLTLASSLWFSRALTHLSARLERASPFFPVATTLLFLDERTSDASIEASAIGPLEMGSSAIPGGRPSRSLLLTSAPGGPAPPSSRISD